VERFTALARWLAEQLNPNEMETLLRAAHLCKADLVTGMVGEFPELQGIMGKAYARLQGESDAVVEAIYEHYLPNRAGGPLPASSAGALLSIADKMDTIVGCFGVGLIPTGTADPFALRRQTLGIIRIALEKSLHFSLGTIVDQAIPLLKPWITEPVEVMKTNVLEFFRGRLHHYLVSHEACPPDVVEAALTVDMDDMLTAAERARSLSLFRARPDFEPLAVAFKRVVNIIKEPERTAVQPSLLKNDAEMSLHQQLSKTEENVRERLLTSNYRDALEAMAELKGPIDAFFDSVLVMDPDADIRRNRLALLTRIRDLFGQVADFRKIHTG
jgi:glycyl-tRNA synthetase beta chain